MDVTAEEKPRTGVLTDAGVALMRRRLGLQYNQPRPPHNWEVTWDGSRHFANGYGDENPLWCDPEYGKATRWGGRMAPPAFHYTMGEPDAPPQSDGEKAILKGDPLAGLGSYQAVMEFEWWRPLRLGDRCKVLQAQVGVVEKPSRFGGRT